MRYCIRWIIFVVLVVMHFQERVLRGGTYVSPGFNV